MLHGEKVLVTCSPFSTLKGRPCHLTTTQEVKGAIDEVTIWIQSQFKSEFLEVNYVCSVMDEPLGKLDIDASSSSSNLAGVKTHVTWDCEAFSLEYKSCIPLRNIQSPRETDSFLIDLAKSKSQERLDQLNNAWMEHHTK